MKSFKVALAQFSPHIGNIDSNTQKMIEQANQAKKQDADLIIFPELSVIGYPAEDLLLRPNLNKRMQKAFAQLSEVKDIVMVFGFVNQTEDGQRYNSAAVMKDGQVLGVFNLYKHLALKKISILLNLTAIQNYIKLSSLLLH